MGWPVHTAFVIADDSEEEDDLRVVSAGLYSSALAMVRLNSDWMFAFDFDALVNVYQVFHPFEL